MLDILLNIFFFFVLRRVLLIICYCIWVWHHSSEYLASFSQYLIYYMQIGGCPCPLLCPCPCTMSTSWKWTWSWTWRYWKTIFDIDFRQVLKRVPSCPVSEQEAFHWTIFYLILDSNAQWRMSDIERFLNFGACPWPQVRNGMVYCTVDTSYPLFYFLYSGHMSGGGGG